jgi:hypothetical protein
MCFVVGKVTHVKKTAANSFYSANKYWRILPHSAADLSVGQGGVQEVEGDLYREQSD